MMEKQQISIKRNQKKKKGMRKFQTDMQSEKKLTLWMNIMFGYFYGYALSISRLDPTIFILISIQLYFR